MLLQIETLQDSNEPASGHPVAPCYDEPFLARLRGRDPQAFDQMMNDQIAAIHRLVCRLLAWDPDCDDVVQEVFVTAWEKIGQFRGEARLSSWLYAIAINHCRRSRRRRATWSKVFRNLCLQDQTNQSPDQIDSDIERVQIAMNQLNHKDRELIVICTLEDRSIDEASRCLGLRKNTVEVRLHRARKRLKQILSEQDNHE